MARRAKALPIPILVALLVIVGVTLWRQHKKAEQENANRAVIVEPKAETSSRRAPRSDAAPTAPGDNAALGMPSNASAATPDDFLISKPQFVLSYNRDLGIPNWVSWHLGASDLGPVERGQFAPDPALPKGWERITPNDYRNIGFDRGHMCPSGDRTATKVDNAQTFLMTNIIPQAADNNQGPWAKLEDYCRDLARGGDELYIASGGAGPFAKTSNPRVSAPASTWKVIVVLPQGDDDVNRVDARTRVIAVLMPNQNGIRDRDWRTFRTSVSAIERATGYTFFPNVPAAARQALEARVDTE